MERPTQDCGCDVEEVWVDNFQVAGYNIIYCPVHAVAHEMYGGLKASLSALEYAEHYYIPSVSAVAEMWSFVNGYEGSPDIRTIIANVEERK